MSTLKSANSSSLQDPYVKKALLDINDNFVVTPISQANGNVAVISKRFYASTSVKEIELNKTNKDHET